MSITNEWVFKYDCWCVYMFVSIDVHAQKFIYIIVSITSTETCFFDLIRSCTRSLSLVRRSKDHEFVVLWFL